MSLEMVVLARDETRSRLNQARARGHSKRLTTSTTGHNRAIFGPQTGRTERVVGETRQSKPTITDTIMTKPQQKQPRRRKLQIVIRLCSMMQMIVVLLLFQLDLRRAVQAVSVQRLQVPDLVVIDQLQVQQQQQQQQQQYLARPSAASHPFADNSSRSPFGSSAWTTNQPASELRGPRDGGPQAASLITSQPAMEPSQQQQITFECLISFDRRKDKNLIVKWHHDERSEPIYQWIPELNKRFIAPQYRAYIAPITGQLQQQQQALQSTSHQQQGHSELGGVQASSSAALLLPTGQQLTSGPASSGNAGNAANNNSNQIQLLEAGFRLIRPTKELGGKYTCSAISSQNDDSKSKKMIVYTPPKSFRFNATRADIGALLASQRDRLIQMTQPAGQPLGQLPAQSGQLPLVYRMRGLEPQPPQAPQMATTISPQMYSTIDYVNVNQQRARQQLAGSGAGGGPALASIQLQRAQPQPQQVARIFNFSRPQTRQQQLGVKLVCDIDQVFPVPEVSIYRLAKPDGSHPEKLAKLDTRIERDVHSGLFHVQVTSILDDDELQAIARQSSSWSSSSFASSQDPGGEIYFECLIALTNLELSKYADNKRSIIYRPGKQQQLLQQQQQLASGLQVGANYQQQQQDLAGNGGSSLEPLGADRSSASGASARWLNWPQVHMLAAPFAIGAILFLT